MHLAQNGLRELAGSLGCQPSALAARMPVPKLVCEVSCASGFASSMDGDVSRDTRGIVQKARLNSVSLEKRNLGTHMRATAKLVDAVRLW
jgi:hypothetical protein